MFTDILGQVSLTSSISGRNACLSEEVTFTCTAQTTAVFWGSEEFGEKTMHYTSPRSRGEFRAEIVSYQQNCLVSSLSFRATASRNGTTVTFTSRDRSSSQSLSLHIVSSEYIILILICKTVWFTIVFKLGVAVFIVPCSNSYCLHKPWVHPGSCL